MLMEKIEAEWVTEWNNALEAFYKAHEQEKQLQKAHDKAETTTQPFWNGPEMKIQYDADLGVINGVDVGVAKLTHTLRPRDIDNKEFKDHPKMPEFRSLVEQWKKEKAAAYEETDLPSIAKDWEKAVGIMLEAWRNLASTPVATLSALLEKIDICSSHHAYQADDYGLHLMDCVRSDLERIEKALPKTI